MQTFTRIPISITFIRSITLTAVCTLGLSLSVHAQNQRPLEEIRMDSRFYISGKVMSRITIPHPS